MQNLKVSTFHPAARNTLVFVVLSFFLIILQRSLQSSLPFMNVVFLRTLLLAEWPLLLLALPTAFMLMRHRFHARTLFAIFCCAIVFRSLEGLFLNFNKVLMVVLFIYVCMAYGLYQLLTWTFTRAVFSPNFTPADLHPPMAHRVKVQLKSGGEEWQGYLTNWDAQGAFVYLALPWNAAAFATLTVVMEGREFEAKGSVVTTTWDARGIGVEWDKSTVPGKLPWSSLVELFSDLGWQPYLLR